MPVVLNKPENKNPQKTHKYNLDTEIFDGENWGTIFDRGYTHSTEKPLYAYICDDNIQRTIIENNIVEVNIVE
jgi:nucleoside 2-deoxyribosyltransferase